MTERKKIGLREIRTLKAGEILWDKGVVGFGARRQMSDAVAYILFYRTKEGRQRWYTIGRHGSPWTPDTAREEAQRLMGEVADGQDPAADKQAKRKASTVSELCDMYLKDAEAGLVKAKSSRKPKKKSTLAVDKGRIERHIKPLLGHLKVASVTREDIEGFMDAVASGKTAVKAKTDKKRGFAIVRGGMGTASRAVGFLGGVFTYAVRHKMRTDNPVRGVERPKDGERRRRLSDEEYKLLGDALREAEEKGIWPPAVAATRFLALTGWRRSEAINLRWNEVDFRNRTANLENTKTGASARALSRVALDVLHDMRAISGGRADGLVFPPTRGDKSMAGYTKLWWKISALSKPDKEKDSEKKGLPKEITPHVFRHSFASLAADDEQGYSEVTIAALLGHKGRSITSKYTHAADAAILAAADVVANKTAELMGIVKPSAKIFNLRKVKNEN